MGLRIKVTRQSFNIASYTRGKARNNKHLFLQEASWSRCSSPWSLGAEWFPALFRNSIGIRVLVEAKKTETPKPPLNPKRKQTQSLCQSVAPKDLYRELRWRRLEA